MSDIRDIQPSAPVKPIRRRYQGEDEPPPQPRRRRPLPDSAPPPDDADDGHIDEYA